MPPSSLLSVGLWVHELIYQRTSRFTGKHRRRWLSSYIFQSHICATSFDWLAIERTRMFYVVRILIETSERVLRQKTQEKRDEYMIEKSNGSASEESFCGHMMARAHSRSPPSRAQIDSKASEYWFKILCNEFSQKMLQFWPRNGGLAAAKFPKEAIDRWLTSSSTRAYNVKWWTVVLNLSVSYWQDVPAATYALFVYLN